MCKPWCAATQAAACQRTLTLRHPGSDQTSDDEDEEYDADVKAHLETQLRLLRKYSSRVKSLKLEQPHEDLLPTILQVL